MDRMACGSRLMTSGSCPTRRVILVAMLAQRLGVEALAGASGGAAPDRPGAASAGGKVLALIYAMVLGADSIDDTGVLRAGRTGRLLGGWIPRAVDAGDVFARVYVRACAPAVLGRALERAWKAGAGPGAGRLVIDVDSFVGEVCGRLKPGCRLPASALRCGCCRKSPSAALR